MAIIYDYNDDGSISIKVNEYTTDNSIRDINVLKNKGIIRLDMVQKAVIDYEFNRCTKAHEDMKEGDYPLRLEGGKLKVFVSAVSAGYGGEGPHGTVKILEILGFPITPSVEDKIFSKQKLTLSK